ncbi:hypothetical protein [Kutzneria sp. 744]|nr:hypothetical protein [Kutzneria sp. 744]
MLFLVLVVVVILLLLVAASLRMVQQYEQGIVFLARGENVGT